MTKKICYERSDFASGTIAYRVFRDDDYLMIVFRDRWYWTVCITVMEDSASPLPKFVSATTRQNAVDKALDLRRMYDGKVVF